MLKRIAEYHRNLKHPSLGEPKFTCAAYPAMPQDVWNAVNWRRRTNLESRRNPKDGHLVRAAQEAVIYEAAVFHAAIFATAAEVEELEKDSEGDSENIRTKMLARSLNAVEIGTVGSAAFWTYRNKPHFDTNKFNPQQFFDDLANSLACQDQLYRAQLGKPDGVDRREFVQLAVLNMAYIQASLCLYPIHEENPKEETKFPITNNDDWKYQPLRMLRYAAFIGQFAIELHDVFPRLMTLHDCNATIRALRGYGLTEKQPPSKLRVSKMIKLRY